MSRVSPLNADQPASSSPLVLSVYAGGYCVTLTTVVIVVTTTAIIIIITH